MQEDEGYEAGRNPGSSVSTGGESTTGGSGKRRSWDDEFVLKRQFSALIPAFDPRPGRTNVNQTTDLEVPAPQNCEDETPSSVGPVTEHTPQPRIQLVLRGPNIPGVSVKILLNLVCIMQKFCLIFS